MGHHQNNDDIEIVFSRNSELLTQVLPEAAKGSQCTEGGEYNNPHRRTTGDEAHMILQAICVAKEWANKGEIISEMKQTNWGNRLCPRSSDGEQWSGYWKNVLVPRLRYDTTDSLQNITQGLSIDTIRDLRELAEEFFEAKPNSSSSEHSGEGNSKGKSHIVFGSSTSYSTSDDGCLVRAVYDMLMEVSKLNISVNFSTALKYVRSSQWSFHEPGFLSLNERFNDLAGDGHRRSGTSLKSRWNLLADRWINEDIDNEIFCSGVSRKAILELSRIYHHDCTSHRFPCIGGNGRTQCD